VRLLVRDLNRLYRATPALYELDAMPEGFAWIDSTDTDQSCLSYLRRGRDPRDLAIIVCNFTPVPRHGYRIGVPEPGRYAERINTDAAEYGGSGIGNYGGVGSEPVPWHGHAQSLRVSLPPLATTIFTLDPA
jgi:1,4-alpha-glucan branching enzyme